ncbi:RNA polymerase sigma factor [Microbacter margulisiae]|uniref:RNA polymerase sigma-70 factor (ECF subfamily) n=1 Tax=Microbacter margulisiae TaxID=1350067 RepID=A0A7W5DRB9_9PORP|nr:sigma-70 family RNA polymerase sigma factor [Microbacter margulisiae]MBB3187298.1 RNA polymerase sigma-70 factor (ECF subfamily) [Microbacter margulisiae]
MSPEKFKAEILPLRERLFHIAWKMLEEKQDAEDAVQEVFLKLWHIRESLGQYESTTAFATTMTKNLCIDKLRGRTYEDSLDDELYRQAGPDNPYLELERKNTGQILRVIIDRLPPLQQAIIRMKDIEEYEVEEIAEITGTQPEAVRMNLSRARKKVREEYIRLTR